MTPSDINLAVALFIIALAIIIGVSHVRTTGWQPDSGLGVIISLFALLGVITAYGAWAHSIPEWLSFAAAMLRGSILVLLLSYGIYHFREVR